MGLLKAIQDAGHQVIAIAPKDDYSIQLEKAGFVYFPISMENKGANPIKDFFLIQEFKRIYKEIQPDVILQYTIKPNIYGTLAAKSLRIPVINNVSGLGTVFIHNNLVSKIAKSLYKYAFRYPTKVFFQNNDDLSLFVENQLVKVEKTGLLAGSGINLNKFTQQPYPLKKEFTFLLVARLLYDKGIREYIEAIRILRMKGNQSIFQLCGFFDLASNLGVTKKEVREWENEGIIEYIGKTDDIQETMKEIHCVVLPSYREGTPKTLIEAASLGKPIVTTNVPGCKEVVIDGQNGFLCEVKNGKDLAKKMDKISELSKEEWNKMANQSRKLAETKFDEKFVIKKYLEVINKI